MRTWTRIRQASIGSLLFMAGLVGFCTGCNPQSMAMLLGTFTDNKVEPDYKLFGDKDVKEITLAILVNFRESQFKDEICKADTEMADQLAQFLRKRCDENKHKLKLVPQAQVRNTYFKQSGDGGADPVELGRSLKADYVLHLEIEKFAIYEPKSFPKMFHGQSDIAISLYRIKTKESDDGNLVFGPKDYIREYPATKPPIPADGANPNVFRRMFLSVAAQEISRMFIAYPPEEKHAELD